jgi:hypothetical protein
LICCTDSRFYTLSSIRNFVCSQGGGIERGGQRVVKIAVFTKLFGNSYRSAIVNEIIDLVAGV